MQDNLSAAPVKTNYKINSSALPDNALTVLCHFLAAILTRKLLLYVCGTKHLLTNFIINGLNGFFVFQNFIFVHLNIEKLIAPSSKSGVTFLPCRKLCFLDASMLPCFVV